MFLDELLFPDLCVGIQKRVSAVYEITTSKSIISEEDRCHRLLDRHHVHIYTLQIVCGERIQCHSYRANVSP